MNMNDKTEKHWHLDRFQKAALYWNNLANQQIFEVNKQLLALATIILPLTASIVTVQFITLREYQKVLLILSWVSLFASIFSGLIQIRIDALYFQYLSNDSSSREKFWAENDNERAREKVNALGETKSGSSFTPTYFQVFFVSVGLLFIMIVAVSILLAR